MDSRQRTLQLAEAISDAIGTLGPAPPLSADTDTRTLQVLERTARYLGVLEPYGAAPVAVEFDIGSALDYATIAAWENDWDNAGAGYSSGADAIGYLADQTHALLAPTTLAGGGTIGLSSVTLTTVAGTGARHSGMRGTGASIVVSSGGQRLSIGSTPNLVIEWCEFDGGDVATGRPLVDVNADCTIRNCILYDNDDGVGEECINIDSAAADVLNCVLHTGGGEGIRQFVGGASTSIIRNCTIHGFGEHGIEATDATDNYVQNCLITGNGTADVSDAAITAATHDYNAVSDNSDSGANSFGADDGFTVTGLYVDTSDGFEDLHIDDAAADVIDAGFDFGATPAGVNIDINGRDRDANGDTWDIGAHEYVAAGGGAAIAALAHHHRMMLSA